MLQYKVVVQHALLVGPPVKCHGAEQVLCHPGPGCPSGGDRAVTQPWQHRHLVLGTRGCGDSVAPCTSMAGKTRWEHWGDFCPARARHIPSLSLGAVPPAAAPLTHAAHGRFPRSLWRNGFRSDVIQRENLLSADAGRSPGRCCELHNFLQPLAVRSSGARRGCVG